MTFPEFVEALCRVASKLSIPNLMEEAVDPEDWLDPVLISRWEAKSLAQKIESFLLLAANRCLGQKSYDEAVSTLQAFKEMPSIYANDIEVTGSTKKLEKTIKDYEALAAARGVEW